MSQDTETQSQTTNSYTSILRSSGSLKSGCAKCDAKNLPICGCCKGGSVANESEEKSSAFTEITKNNNALQQSTHFSTPHFKSTDELNKEDSMLLLSGSQQAFQFTLKPTVKFITALLEQFIRKLAHNDGIDFTRDDISIKELGRNLGICYDDTQQNSLAITFKNPEHFDEFFSLLRDEKLIVMKQEQVQEMENIMPEVNNQSFNPSPFSMSLTPVKGF